ncbi:MAG: hypothetical protein EOO45_13335 [Flavobacterium sp.]|nr:MAG: hypothetical protein EOO45_13335 [Flavobacterium sp.]
MKQLFVLLCFSFFSKAVSQDMPKDSIIYLEEISVSRDNSKREVERIKTKGKEMAADAFQYTSTEVSLIDNIPDGYLRSIKFFFNTGLGNQQQKDFQIKYKDIELGLVIYEVNADGIPGQALSDNDIRFVVKRDHKGSVELNLSPLYLRSQKKLFFGLRAITEQTGRNIVLKIMNNETAYTFCKPQGSDAWRRLYSNRKNNYHLKIEVGILTDE